MAQLRHTSKLMFLVLILEYMNTAGFTCFLLSTNLIERNFGTSPGDEMIRNESVASAHCIMRFAFQQMDFYAHCPVFKRLSNYKKPENLVHLT